MKYINISQLFYKLYSVVFALLLLPMILFIAMYTFLPVEPVVASSDLLTLSILLFIVLDWAVMYIVTSNKMKTIRKAQGLGLKLEKYFTLTIVRYSAIAFASVFLGVGFYLTNDNIFPVFLVINLVASMLFWPAPHRVAKVLHLRGDEYEMVYYKKDRF